MHWILINIKRLRIEKNYTQEAMALELGISTSWYNKLENGHKKLTLKQLETIAKTLNVQLKEILSDHNNVFPPHFSPRLKKFQKSKLHYSKFLLN